MQSYQHRAFQTVLKLIMLNLMLLFQACQVKLQPVLPVDEAYEAVIDQKELYSQIIANHPGSIDASEAQYRLGLIELSENDMEKARFHFESVSSKNEHLPWTVFSLIELSGSILATEIDITTLTHCLELLQTSDFDVQEPIRRAHYYIGVWFYRQEDWIVSLDYLNRSGPLSSEPSDLINFHTLTGVSYARLGKYDLAFIEFDYLLNSGFSGINEALIELADLLVARQRYIEAVDTFISHSHLLEDHETVTRFMQLLEYFPHRSDLNELMSRYRTGKGAFLIRKEYIIRLWDEGLPDLAWDHLIVLENRYPEYSGTLQPLRSMLLAELNVNYEKIGILVPLSGNLASMGHSIYRGAQLAVSDYVDAGGKIPFSLVPVDSGDTRDAAIKGFEKLIDDDNVLAIIGPVRSAVTETLIPFCDDRRIVMITPGCPREKVVKESKWVFRLYPSVFYEMRELIRFAVRDLGLFRFGILYPDIEYGMDALEAADIAIFEESATLVFNRRYLRDLSNIQQALTLLSDTSSDVVIIADQSERAALVAGHFRYNELLTPTLAGLSAWESSTLLDAAGTSLESGFFVSSYPLSTQPRNDIAQRYLRRFGEQADGFAMRSYETVLLVLTAVESDVRYRSQLRSWFSSDKKLRGLDGNARFSESGEFEPPVTVFKIRGSRFIPWQLIPVR